ncbi:MAG: SRPBCC domain-containing protein [Candidatus Eremiobacterota bacterium]
MKIKEKIYIHIPMHIVWNFLNREEEIKKWWSVEFKEKAIVDDKSGYSGHIISMEKGRNISFSWTCAVWPCDTTVTLNTYPEPAGTILEITHEGWEIFPEKEREEAMAYSEKYWHEVMKNLKTLAEGRSMA